MTRLTLTGGAITIDAGDLITQDGAIGSDNTTASVAITSTTGSIDSNNTIDALGDISVDAGQDVDLLDLVTSGAALSLNAGGSIAAVSTITGDSVEVDGGADVSLAEVNAEAGDALLAAGLDLTLTGVVDAATGNIVATAGNDLTQLAALGSDQSTNNVTLTATTGTLTSSDTVDAIDSVDATAGLDLNVAAPITAANGSIALTTLAGDLNSGEILTAETGVIVDGAANVSVDRVLAFNGDTTLRAGSNITLTDAVDARGGNDVVVWAGQNVTQTAAVGGDQATDNVTLTADTGAILSTNTIDAAMNVALTSGSSTTLGAAVVADTGDITIGSGVNVTAADELTATAGAIDIDAVEDVALAALVTAGTTIDVNAGGTSAFAELHAGDDITLDADVDLTLTGAVNADGADIVATAGRDLTATAALGGDQTTDNIDLTAVLGTVTTSSTVDATETIDYVAGANIVAGQTDALDAITTDNGSITFDAGEGIAINTIVTANDSVLADAETGSITTGDDLIRAVTGEVDLAAGGSLALGAGGTRAFTNATLAADDNLTQTGDIFAGEAISLTASTGALSTIGTSDAGSFSADAGDSINLDGDVVTETGGVAIGQTIEPSGSIVLDATIDSDTTVAIDAGGDITLNAADEIISNDGTRIDAGNVLDLNGNVTASTVTLNADDDLSIAGVTTATDGAILATAGGNAVITDLLEATTDVTVSAAGNLATDEIMAGVPANPTTGHVTLTAGESLVMNDAIDAVGNLTATATVNITQNAEIGLEQDTEIVTFSAETGSVTSSNVIWAASDINVTAGTDVSSGSSQWTADTGSVTVAADEDVTLNNRIEANDNISVTAKHALNAGNQLLLAATGDISLSGGDVSVGVAGAEATAGNIDIDATLTDAAIRGDLTAGNGIAVDAAGAISTAEAVLDAHGDDGDVVLTAGSNINLGIGSAEAGDDVILTAGENINQIGDIRANTHAGNTELDSEGDVILTATTGAITTTGQVLSGVNYTADAANSITLGDLAGAANNGNIDVTGNVHVGQNIEPTGDIDFNADINADGEVLVDGGHDITLAATEDIIAVGDVNIDAGATALVDGDINGHDITLRGEHALLINGELNATGETNLSGGTIDATSAITSATDVTVRSDEEVTLAEVEALGGFVDIYGGGHVTLNGDIEATTDVTVFSLDAGITQIGNIGTKVAVDTADNVTLTAAVGTIVSSGNINAVNDITIDAHTDATLSALLVADTGNVNLLSNNADVVGLSGSAIEATVGDVNVTAGSDVSLADTVNAGTDFNLNAVETITLGGAVTTGGAVNVGQTTRTTGELAINAAVDATGPIDIDAEGGIEVADVLVDGDAAVTIDTLGSIDLNGTLTGDSIAVRSAEGNLEVDGVVAADGSTVLLSAAGNVGIDDTVDAATDVTVWAGDSISQTAAIGSGGLTDAISLTAELGTVSSTANITGISTIDVTAGTDATFANDVIGSAVTVVAGQDAVTRSGIVDANDGAVAISANRNVTLGSGGTEATNGVTLAADQALWVNGNVNADSNSDGTGDIDLDATNGSLWANGTLDGANLTADAGNTLTIAGNTTTTGAIIIGGTTVPAGDISITATNVDATGDITVNGGADVSQSGTLDTDGALSITNGGAVDLDGTVGAASIALDAAGDVDAAGTLSIDGSGLTIESDSDVSLSEAISAVTNVTINADGSIEHDSTLTAVTASLKATNGDITSGGAITLSGDLSADAGQNVRFDDTVTAATIEVGAGADLRTTELVSATAGNASLRSSEDATIGSGGVTATGDVSVWAANSLDQNGALSAGGNVSAIAQTGGLTVDATIDGTDVTLDANDTLAINSDVTATSDLLIGINTPDEINVDANLTGTDSLTVRGQGDLTQTGGHAISSDGLIDVNVGGALTLHGSATGSDLNLAADAATVAVLAAIGGDAAIIAREGDAIFTDTVDATGALTIGANGAVETSSTLTAGALIDIDATTGDIDLGGAVIGGAVSGLAAGDIHTDAAISAIAGSVELTSTTGEVDVAGVTASDAIALDAAANLAHGALNAGGDVSANAGGSWNGASIVGNNVAANAAINGLIGDITADGTVTIGVAGEQAGVLELAGVVDAAGAVNVVGEDDVTLSGASLDSDSTVNISAAENLSLIGTVGGTEVTLTGANVTASSVAADAGDVTATSVGAVSISEATATNSIAISADSITLNDATADSDTNNDGDLLLTAVGAVNLSGDNSAENATVTAGDFLMASDASLAVVDSVDVTATGVAAISDIGATNATISADSIIESGDDSDADLTARRIWLSAENGIGENGLTASQNAIEIDGGVEVGISTVTWNGTDDRLEFGTNGDHGLQVGDQIVVSGTDNYNGPVEVTQVIDSTTFVTSQTHVYDEAANLGVTDIAADGTSILTIAYNRHEDRMEFTTSGNHGLEPGDVIAINNTGNFNGAAVVVTQVLNGTTFVTGQDPDRSETNLTTAEINRGVTYTTAGQHGLRVGDEVELADTTGYNGTAVVTCIIDDTTFVTNQLTDADEVTGTLVRDFNLGHAELIATTTGDDADILLRGLNTVALTINELSTQNGDISLVADNDIVAHMVMALDYGSPGVDVDGDGIIEEGINGDLDDAHDLTLISNGGSLTIAGTVLADANANIQSAEGIITDLNGDGDADGGVVAGVINITVPSTVTADQTFGGLHFQHDDHDQQPRRRRNRYSPQWPGRQWRCRDHQCE